jgi:hypothetical protein
LVAVGVGGRDSVSTGGAVSGGDVTAEAGSEVSPEVGASVGRGLDVETSTGPPHGNGHTPYSRYPYKAK